MRRLLELVRIAWRANVRAFVASYDAGRRGADLRTAVRMGQHVGQHAGDQEQDVK